MRKIELVTAVAVVVFWTYQAAHAQCDNCPTPHVVIYGVKMKVPIPPADSAGFYTTPSSQQALANWISLDTLVNLIGSVMVNDPDKDCVNWTEGSLAYGLSTLSDSLGGVELEGDTVSDVPPSGKLKGVEYLVWGEVDSSGGKYHFHVYLEDGYSRDRIASGEADFTKPGLADSAGNKAISTIEEDFLSYFTGEWCASLKSIADRFEELLFGAFLEKVADGPCPQRLEDLLIVAIHSKHQNFYCRVVKLDNLKGFDARPHRHFNVKKENVGQIDLYALNSLVTILVSPDAPETFRRVKKVGQESAILPVVIQNRGVYLSLL